MNILERLTLAEMEEFVAGNDQVDWTVVKGESLYGLIERVLKAQQYSRISKGQKETVRRFLNKVTALSRALGWEKYLKMQKASWPCWPCVENHNEERQEKRCGNAGSVESMENQKQVSHPSHPSHRHDSFLLSN